MMDYNSAEIRPACISDIGDITRLLSQVLEVHAHGRPDIFRSGTVKYRESELAVIITDPNTPVFICETDGKVAGYAFCIYQQTPDKGCLIARKTLYIDDLCVDEAFRRHGVGERLYRFVLSEAEKNGCQSVTLNVWEMNEPAKRFYEKMGMKPLKTTMECRLECGSD